MKGFLERHVIAGRSLFHGLLDLVAPPRCMACLREGSWLCPRCEERFPFYAQRCAVCQQEQLRGKTCLECRSQTELTGIISAGHYGLPALRRGIHWLKFKGVRSISPTLTQLLIPRLWAIAPLPQLFTYTALVPMPLHQKRLQERGFNQAHDLAHALSTQTLIPVHELLRRTRATMRQSNLPKDLRAQNVKGAFELAGTIPSSVTTIIIVDDVATTATTLSAAALALRPYFSGQLWAVTVARGWYLMRMPPDMVK